MCVATCFMVHFNILFNIVQLRLMEEILLTSWYGKYPSIYRWLFGISSINSIMMFLGMQWLHVDIATETACPPYGSLIFNLVIFSYLTPRMGFRTTWLTSNHWPQRFFLNFAFVPRILMFVKGSFKNTLLWECLPQVGFKMSLHIHP